MLQEREVLKGTGSAGPGAAPGTRPSRASWRARALCDRHGIDWRPVLNQVRRAYEATLSESEVRKRDKGSINGLPDWIDRRAS
jgi:hypothetical protein